MSLATEISEALQQAVVCLDEDVVSRIVLARKTETNSSSLAVLDAILTNLDIARAQRLPMCQDTGMFLVFVDVGRECKISLGDIEAAINEGCKDAVENAYFRRSVVNEPLFERRNTETNLPPVIWWNLVEGSALTIRILLKGFGSENTSSVRMLNPTASSDDVIASVKQIVALAGAKPCPPIFVGVGLGGSMDRAAYLSKRALLREVGVPHVDTRYAALEKQMLEAIQTLHIGSGGLGGDITALNVAIEVEPTHIAGLPLAVSINCWADRKAVVYWEADHA
ncbi:MAG: fumarate hydratase [Spirochaetia bacterium]|nr:fumarate hydratase [Spirochaetia bacterium]